MRQLDRRIGVPGAVAIGLGAMIGAGLFAVWAPASEAAGSWLPLALVLAGAVAMLNALSTSQLAMEHPVAGGAYAYGRAEVGPRVGFAAGLMFLTGKTASAAAIAVIAGRHLWPEHAVPVGVAAVVVLAALNMLGVRVTAWTSAAIVGLVLVALFAGLMWSWVGGAATLTPIDGDASEPPWTPLGVLQAAGLLFFAFAGYARMATLGEEAKRPRQTIPLAIVIALSITLALYALVGATVSSALGPNLSRSATPVADLAADGGLHTVLLVGGALACLGSLIGILAGLSRTGFAMARDGDLPGVLSRIAQRSRTPVVAETCLAALAVIGVVTLPPGALIARSSTCVLTYYCIANVAAIRMRRRGARMWLPVWVRWLGAAACAVLALSLPWPGVVGAALWLAVGFAARRIFGGGSDRTTPA